MSEQDSVAVARARNEKRQGYRVLQRVLMSLSCHPHVLNPRGEFINTHLHNEVFIVMRKGGDLAFVALKNAADTAFPFSLYEQFDEVYISRSPAGLRQNKVQCAAVILSPHHLDSGPFSEMVRIVMFKVDGVVEKFEAAYFERKS